MDVGQIILDFAIPISLISFGAYFEKNPGKKWMVVLGHRTRRARQSDEAWDYANRRLGSLWKKWGAILLLVIALSYLANPMSENNLHIFNSVIGVIFIFIPTFIIEGELKKKFGDPKIERTTVQGLRDNKKLQKEQEIKQQYKKEKQKEKEKKKEQKNREKSNKQSSNKKK